MKNTAKFLVSGEEKTFDTKEITLICHRDEVNLKPLDSDIEEINATMTVPCADALTVETWNQIRTIPNFLKMWHCIFPGVTPPETLKGEGLGYRHVVGMLVLIVQALAKGKRPFLRFPETYLHPAAQLGLGDLLLMLSTGKERGKERP